ncbi:MAG: bifunctional (p)ppGpp synthetase/guanosine-3',5'-bis(diphosphate) 3'-pyrophosphohydrolase [Pseudomonadota bacterium]
MKRSGRQFRSIERWWGAFKAAHPEGVPDVLDAELGASPPDLDLGHGLRSDEHLLQLLVVLEDLRVDPDTLLAACRYHRLRAGAEDNGALPERTGRLVNQLLDIDKLERDYDPDRTDGDAEGLRRLLLALVRDVPVLLIVVADRLVALRAVAGADPRIRSLFARRAAAIHAPLANRLGIWHLKWELEDLVFRFLQPEMYRRIAGLLDERREDRERYIEELVAEVERVVDADGIDADVLGRPKHIYSIWKKMQRKNLAFDQLFDVRALRVLVDDVAACYQVLGLVHAGWHPIPGEFDDYVANPKPNGYQSLHTAIFGPEGKPVEIQIRTRQMHEDAELGVAAHWRYKEGGSHDPAFQRRLNAMRQLIEASGDDDPLLEDFSAEADDDRVYVLTPRGKVIDLRVGSTVLDFAYHVHTNVGHRCRGAKVNGRIVPLTYEVKNGQQVEVLTGKEPDPSRDWMVPSLGYLKTSRARSKVRLWFRKADHDQNVADGRDHLDRELKRLGLSTADLGDLPERFNKHDLEGVYEGVGTGEITAGQIANALQNTSEPKNALSLAPARPAPVGGGQILIEGVGNLATTLAKCCSPVHGDPIVGYITRTRGVSVHREDCPNVAQLLKEESGRMLDVAWAGGAGAYQADVIVQALDRPGLIRDIGNLLANLRIDVLQMNSQVDSSTGEAEVRLRLRVRDFEQLSFVLSRLAAMPNVFECRRVGAK